MGVSELSPEVRDLVEVTPHSVRFPGVEPQRVWLVLGCLGGMGCTFALGLLGIVGAAVLAWFLPISGFESYLLPMVVLMGAGQFVGGPVGLLLSAFLANLKRPIIVTSGAFAYGGIWAPSGGALEAIRVSGEAGRPFDIYSGATRLTRLPPTIWDYDSVSWLVMRIAEVGGVDWSDARREADWRRWATDAQFRAIMDFDAETEANAERFPDHHGSFVTPVQHEVDIEELTIFLSMGVFSNQIFKIDGTALVSGSESYSVRDIHRVAVWFVEQQNKNGRSWYGEIVMLVGTERVKLGWQRCDRWGGKPAGQLLWVAQELSKHIAPASPAPDRGTVRDVPSQIASLTERSD